MAWLSTIVYKWPDRVDMSGGFQWSVIGLRSYTRSGMGLSKVFHGNGQLAFANSLGTLVSHCNSWPGGTCSAGVGHSNKGK